MATPILKFTLACVFSAFMYTASAQVFQEKAIYYRPISNQSCAVVPAGDDFLPYAGSIYIPDGTHDPQYHQYVVTLLDGTFQGCDQLTAAFIPQSVSKIGDLTFEGCKSLKKLTLPKSIIQIGDLVFVGCDSLRTLFSKSVIPPTCSKSTFTGFNRDSCTLYVPANTLWRYKSAPGWKDFPVILPDSAYKPQQLKYDYPFRNFSQPRFPGADEALMRFISSHMIYPHRAYENFVQGTVIMQMRVTTDGFVSEVKVARSIDPDLDREAIRLCRLFKFLPAMENGVPVSKIFTLPIKFKIPHDVFAPGFLF